MKSQNLNFMNVKVSHLYLFFFLRCPGATEFITDLDTNHHEIKIICIRIYKKTRNFNLKFNSMHVILAFINLQLHVPIYCINKNDYAIFSEFCTGVRRTPRVRCRQCSCHTRRSLSATGRRGL